MIGHILPFLTLSASENMALDYWMLCGYPKPGFVRWRSYGWTCPAFTFGYRQEWSAIRAQIGRLVSPEADWESCRRPSGGGLVDHRNDFTYSIVLPSAHFLCLKPPLETYHSVHTAVSDALNICGADTLLQECNKDCGSHSQSGVCFQQAEPGDVIHATSNRKVAGAAMKRTRDGLLLQGSIDRSSVSPMIDWVRFEMMFSLNLQQSTNCETIHFLLPTDDRPWTNQQQLFESEEWIEKRRGLMRAAKQKSHDTGK